MCSFTKCLNLYLGLRSCSSIMHKSMIAVNSVLFLLNPTLTVTAHGAARHDASPHPSPSPSPCCGRCIMLRDITGSVEQPRLSPSVSHAVRHAGTATPPPPSIITTPRSKHALIHHPVRLEALLCDSLKSFISTHLISSITSPNVRKKRNLKCFGASVDQHHIHYIILVLVNNNLSTRPSLPLIA